MSTAFEVRSSQQGCRVATATSRKTACRARTPFITSTIRSPRSECTISAAIPGGLCGSASRMHLLDRPISSRKNALPDASRQTTDPTAPGRSARPRCFQNDRTTGTVLVCSLRLFDWHSDCVCDFAQSVEELQGFVDESHEFGRFRQLAVVSPTWLTQLR
jgi:hypothetical protein